MAPPRLARQLFSAYLQNNLPELSVHLAANFVVQAALTATRDSATIREALTALSGKFKVRLMPRLAGLKCEQGACCHVGASTCLPWTLACGCRPPNLTQLHILRGMCATADLEGDLSAGHGC